MRIPENNTRFHVALILMLALATRMLFLITPSGSIGSADEAVFGMMAQKIQAFEAFPLYCWEAQYAGAMVSYFGAILFSLFGSGFVPLRMAMLPAALLTPVLFYFIYRKMFGAAAALVGAGFLIFCPYFVLRYTMGALGGYGETFLGTAIIILLSWRIQNEHERVDTRWLSLLLGFVCGFFFYTLFLVLPVILAFAIPAIFFSKKHWKENTIPFSLGGVAGILPLIVHNLAEKGGTFTRAAGRSLSVGRDAVQTPLGDLLQHIVAAKLVYLKNWTIAVPRRLGQYVLPEYLGSSLLAIGGLLLLLVFFWFVAGAFFNTDKNAAKRTAFRQFAIFFVFLMVFQWIANLDRARHMLPLLLIIPVALFFIKQDYNHLKKYKFIVFGLICALQLSGWAEKTKTSFFDPYPVVDIMKKKGVTEFYGSYWTVYPLMFAAEQDLKGAPFLLPKNEIPSDRRPDISKDVQQSESPAFVFASDELKLKSEFAAFLSSNDISADSFKAGTAIVFHNLSKPVHAIIEPGWKTSFSAGPLFQHEEHKERF